MEIFILVLLYYFSQNPQFAESVKPLMAELKNSQQMLRFLEDLSKFTQTFSTFQNQNKHHNTPHEQPPCEDKKDDEKPKENPQSPTQGIADEFIEQLLNQYLSKQ